MDTELAQPTTTEALDDHQADTIRAAADAAVDVKFPDPETRPTMSVDEARPFYGLSRSSMFNAVRNGEVPAIRVGGRWLLPTAAVRRQLGLDP